MRGVLVLALVRGDCDFGFATALADLEVCRAELAACKLAAPGQPAEQHDSSRPEARAIGSWKSEQGFSIVFFVDFEKCGAESCLSFIGLHSIALAPSGGVLASRILPPPGQPVWIRHLY